MIIGKGAIENVDHSAVVEKPRTSITLAISHRQMNQG